MSWYYGVDGRRQGPVEERALETLGLSGAIEWTTPIWRGGHACLETIWRNIQARHRSIAMSAIGRSTRNRRSVIGISTFARDAKARISKKFAKDWPAKRRAILRILDPLLRPNVDGLILMAVTLPLSVINQVIIFRFYPDHRSRGRNEPV